MGVKQLFGNVNREEDSSVVPYSTVSTVLWWSVYSTLWESRDELIDLAAVLLYSYRTLSAHSISLQDLHWSATFSIFVPMNGLWRWQQGSDCCDIQTGRFMLWGKKCGRRYSNRSCNMHWKNLDVVFPTSRGFASKKYFRLTWKSESWYACWPHVLNFLRSSR